MKPRATQFDLRENTASSRQHASRPAIDARSSTIPIEEENPAIPESLPSNENLQPGFAYPLHAAPRQAATGGKTREGTHLLTVHEVAKLLQVPVSWVYGRTRKRSMERLPGFRLGKYWRFREEEILTWVDGQRGGHSAA